jgi:hypothetical protein
MTSWVGFFLAGRSTSSGLECHGRNGHASVSTPNGAGPDPDATKQRDPPNEQPTPDRAGQLGEPS